MPGSMVKTSPGCSGFERVADVVDVHAEVMAEAVEEEGVHRLLGARLVLGPEGLLRKTPWRRRQACIVICPA